MLSGPQGLKNSVIKTFGPGFINPGPLDVYFYSA